MLGSSDVKRVTGPVRPADSLADTLGGFVGIVAVAEQGLTGRFVESASEATPDEMQHARGPDSFGYRRSTR